MQALAREMNFAESVFVLPPRPTDADVRIRIFTPGERAAVRRPPDARQRVRARRAAVEDRDPARDRRGRRAGRARAGGAEIVFGRMEQPIPPLGAGRERRGDPRRASASSAPGCRSSATTSARATSIVELESPAQVAALSPDLAALERAPATASTASPATAPAGRRGCSPRARRRRGPRDRLGRRAARDPPGAPRPDRVRRADRDLAGREISRPSTLYAQADGTRRRSSA